MSCARLRARLLPSILLDAGHVALFLPCSSCNARAAHLSQNLISAAFACGVAISPCEIDALVQRYDLYGHSKVELLDVRVIK